MKVNVEKDRIIEVYKENKYYVHEESKLFDYYIQTVFQMCDVQEINYILEVKLSNSEKLF